MFQYDMVTGAIELGRDSQAVQNYKAGTGALIYALKAGGWSDEQIENGLRTHFESVAAVLVEHLRSHASQQNYSDAFRAVASALIDRIDPAEINGN
jgi:hypothetical protein